MPDGDGSGQPRRQPVAALLLSLPKQSSGEAATSWVNVSGDGRWLAAFCEQDAPGCTRSLFFSFHFSLVDRFLCGT